MNQKKTVVVTAVITFFATIILIYGGYVFYRSPFITQIFSAVTGEYSGASVQRVADIIDAYYYDDVDRQ